MVESGGRPPGWGTNAKWVVNEDFEPERSPEERLLHAIIKQAGQDYLGTNKKLKEDAGKFFYCQEEWDFFEWLCEILEIDPKAIRERLASAIRAGKVIIHGRLVDK